MVISDGDISNPKMLDMVNVMTESDHQRPGPHSSRLILRSILSDLCRLKLETRKCEIGIGLGGESQTQSRHQSTLFYQPEYIWSQGRSLTAKGVHIMTGSLESFLSNSDPPIYDQNFPGLKTVVVPSLRGCTLNTKVKKKSTHKRRKTMVQQEKKKVDQFSSIN